MNYISPRKYQDNNYYHLNIINNNNIKQLFKNVINNSYKDTRKIIRSRIYIGIKIK